MEEKKQKLEKPITRLKDIPAGGVFSLQKSGTIYVKMPDGSIRNAMKAAKKLGLIKKKGRK